MNSKVDEAGGETRVPKSAGGRLPYKKPMLRSEGVFETMALACGKASTTQKNCMSALRNS